MLAEYYSGLDFDFIFSSGLDRALTTAELLRNKQKKNKQLALLPELAEVAIPFEYKGKDFSVLKKQYQSLIMADGYSENGPVVISDGDRTDKRIYERAGRILSYFKDRFTNGEKIAVVAHAGIITYIIYYLLNFRQTCPPADFEFNNSGVTKITFYKPGTFRDDIVIDYVNSTSHLPKEF